MWAPARFGLYVLFDLCGERGTARGVGRPDPRTSCTCLSAESAACECKSQIGCRDATSLQLVHSAIGGRDGGASDERVAQAAGRCACTAAALCAP